MRKIILLMLGILLIISNVSAIDYIVLNNSSAKDIYFYSPGFSGDIIIDKNLSSTENGSAVFEKLYENDWNYTINVSQSSILIPTNLSYLELPMSNGYNQAVHPCVIRFANQWHGYNYWMVVTGYYQTINDDENPHLLCSNDGTNWTTPVNVTNPIVPFPGGDSYSSDPCMVYDSNIDELKIYYRTYNATSTYQEYYVIKYNGTVSNPIFISQEAEDTETDDTSESWSVVYKDGIFHLFAVDRDFNGDIAYATSTNGINFSDRVALSVTDPENFTIKHGEVKYIPEKNKWLMLIHEMNSSNLYFGYSDYPDHGWYYNPVVLKANDVERSWDKNNYKSSFAYIPSTNEMCVWYTGFNLVSSPASSYVGFAKIDYDKLFNYIEHSKFTRIKKDLNVTAYNGYINAQSSYSDCSYSTGVMNYNNSTVIMRGVIQDRGVIAFQANANDAVNRSLLRQRQSTATTYHSIIGSAVVQSTVTANGNAHTFTHSTHGISSVDGVYWENLADIGTSDRRFIIQNVTLLDYVAITDRSIYNIEYTEDGDLISCTAHDGINHLSNVDDVDNVTVLAIVDSFYNDSSTYTKYANGILTSTGIPNSDQIKLNITSNETVVITISDWTADHKIWNESSDIHSATTTHIIGDFVPNSNITIFCDGVKYSTVAANDTGYINWTYNGGYSEHIFEIISDDAASVTISNPGTITTTSDAIVLTEAQPIPGLYDTVRNSIISGYSLFTILIIVFGAVLIMRGLNYI